MSACPWIFLVSAGVLPPAPVVSIHASAAEEPAYLGMTRGDLDFWDRAASSAAAACDHRRDCCNGDRACANRAACEARGCCWDPHTRSNWCSGSPGPTCNASSDCGGHGRCTGAPSACVCDKGWEGLHCTDVAVTSVHVVQSCHLDVGFDGSIQQVLSEYFTRYIPNAIATAAAMRADPTLPPGWRSNFMLQSYYVSLYLDCPAGIGLPCPTQEAAAALRAAAQRGDVHWHAFPHNAELEMGTPTLLAAAVNMTHNLDGSLGLPPKRVLSQRDVPGISRAAIPVLKAAGVHAVSVGVNTASMYPRVPKIFRWQDPASAEELYAMWHGRGYGGYSVNEAVRVQGLAEVLVTDWNGDNQGPSDKAGLVALFKKISGEFPGAAVFVSTFDNFTSLLEPYKANIPVVTQEIGDTWIYGTPSDPVKQATMRASMRAWADYTAAGGAQDAVYLNASRLLVKSIEHTWGDHVELGGWQRADSWSNPQFNHDRNSTEGNAVQTFSFLESTWWEQRQYCTGFAADTLSAAGHPLWKDFLEPELAALNEAVVAPDPSAQSFTRLLPADGPVKVGNFTLGFDSSTGALTKLSDSWGRAWASAANPLLALIYQTYNISQFQAFQRAYSNLTNPPGYFPHDFGKPNDTEAVYHDEVATAVSFWRKTADGVSTILIETEFSNPALHAEYGAPATIWIELTIPFESGRGGGPGHGGGPSIDVSVLLINKTATRHAEAMFMQLNPPAASMEMDKLGSWIPLAPGLVVDGGNKHMHGVNSGVRFSQTGGGSMTLETLDAGVVVFGDPVGFPTIGAYGNGEPDLSKGVSSMMLNNLWGTNYVMWYPYRDVHGQDVPGMENIRYRYRLTFGL